MFINTIFKRVFASRPVRKGLGVGLLLFLCAGNILADNKQLAFPGADGYGKYVTGGRGGEVCYVTRLDDCSDNELVPGTLRWAIRHDNGGKPRTILFATSGTIYLTSILKFQYPDVSILGQSAPGGGVCVAGYNIYICKDNVIVRYVRFRAGDIPDKSMTGLDVENCKGVIIDHCSLTWSMEECLTAYDTDNTTVQWCIIGEGLYNSKNSKGARAYATQWGGEHSTMHHTLITNSHSRSPRFNGVRSYSKTKGEHDYEVDSEFANNVIFNWSATGAIYGGEYDPSKVEQAGTWTDDDKGYDRVYMINNFYRPGPSTKKNATEPYFASPSAPYGEWYLNGNKFEVSGRFAPWTAGAAESANTTNVVKGLPSSYLLSQVPYPLSGMTYDDAENAYNAVVTTAGASLPRYDEVDQRLLNEAAGKVDPKYYGSLGNGDLGIIDSPDNVVLNTPGVYYANSYAYANYPSLALREGDKYAVDTDGDGMPDKYETEHGLNPNDATDGAKDSGNGYTNLEVYLNAIADGTINKVNYETSVHPTVAGSMQTLPSVAADGSKYVAWTAAGFNYEVDKEQFIPADVTPVPVVRIVYYFDGIDPVSVIAGTEIVLPTAVKQDYKFIGWSDGTNTYEGGSKKAFSTSLTLIPKFEKISGPVERVLYTSNFQTGWTAAAKSSTAASQSFTTDYTSETLTFTYQDVEVKPTGENAKFISPATTGYLMSDKKAGAYIETSSLANVSEVSYVHCATGSNRGWKLLVKGDGDEDWVVLSDAVATPAGGQLVTKKVNRKNCKIRFVAINTAENAYMTEITIKGLVTPETPQETFSFMALPSPIDAGKVTVSPDEYAFEAGAEVKMTANAADGYVLDSWTDDKGEQLGNSPVLNYTVTGEVEIHANFKHVSDYAYIFEDCKPYDAVVANYSELAVALKAASKRNDQESRYRIFLRNGKYDFGNIAKTAIPMSTSLIGESQQGVVILNNPGAVTDYQNETPVLFIDQNQNDVYMQDLTIRQDRDWNTKKSQGQAVALRQRGKRAAYKNVTLQGVQDTYYINKADATAYFETSTLAGEVDFIYGDGTVWFENCNIQPVSSGAVITASNAQPGYIGMVFNGCVIETEPSVDGSANGYALGRPWNDSPAVTYLNTTMKTLPLEAGWKAMKSGLVCRFHEYGSKNAEGTALDLSKRSIAACSADVNSDNPVINATQAAQYSVASTFPSWSPQMLTAQVTPTQPFYDSDKHIVYWDMAPNAIGYAVYSDGVLQDVTTECFMNDVEGAVLSVRAINQMGGLGEMSAKAEPGEYAGITNVTSNSQRTGAHTYNLSGQRVKAIHKGIVIVNGKKFINK